MTPESRSGDNMGHQESRFVRHAVSLAAIVRARLVSGRGGLREISTLKLPSISLTHEAWIDLRAEDYFASALRLHMLVERARAQFTARGKPS